MDPEAKLAVKTLAIVIPAFKVEFLNQVLMSLSINDLSDVNVYVAKDGSPHPIREVVDRWVDKLPLYYTRFANNLGKEDLAEHWNRSIRLSSEPWLWLPGDDDEFEPDSVTAVLARIRADGKAASDLYRLNVLRIDSDSKITKHFEPYPPNLSATTFLRHRFEGTLYSFAPEYVFRREAWDQIGGFVSFPLAWCSDDATWALLSRRHGIATIEGPGIRWRQSGLNITSPSAEHAEKKVEAVVHFINWRRSNWSLFDSTTTLERFQLFASAMGWVYQHISGNLKGWARWRAELWALHSAKDWRLLWAQETAKRIWWDMHSRQQHVGRGSG